MCIKREETTHVKIGEEDIHHIYIYIYIKDKYNVIYIYIYISKISTMYVKMVTRPVYKKLKETPKTTR